MKNYIIFFGLFFVISGILLSCDRKTCSSAFRNEIIVTNNSQRHIRYIIYWNYSDSLIGRYNPLNDGSDGLRPYQTVRAGGGPASCLEEDYIGGKKSWIYFFDHDSLSVIPWGTVRTTGRGSLKGQLIDLEYLRANNFIVTYSE